MTAGVGRKRRLIRQKKSPKVIYNRRTLIAITLISKSAISFGDVEFATIIGAMEDRSGAELSERIRK